ncbi:hypothetical protein [Rathayibacter toxicus]|uniref:Uncharacterized protein n=1 Tax=Rathayibacter toxicus TaxID=145458 RepID=A0A0C5BGC0_9MICO|nr:hypothetical protein [Rathayibacter toxicus]AJM78154.1 hypothetical protein TI83_09865 [Rathayibacter toxicus]ALS57580.1 hypothetical protein APU90_07200 [Rathayibacter toxicus]KKM44936.1 hypothetical protein VT73_07365 [Rathayibacter toxicus]PPG20752.1 hypothetical protein C5D15_09725 [Rathayibacter toxicus]PPG45855.1 hypothetical protein C5D16_09690 [Rathayibacter toxicus]
MSITALRIVSAVGAAIAALDAGLIAFLVIEWHPLATAPTWLVSTTDVVLVVGITFTIISTTALSRRTHHDSES